MRSRQDSLSIQPPEHESDYVSSADGREEGEDDSDLARPEDRLSEDESIAMEATRSLGNPTANGSPAMSAGTVVSPVHRVTQCACRMDGLHYIEPIIDTVLPDTPERIYNLMFASSEFLKDFMRLNQKLDGKSRPLHLPHLCE
jgi:hypothetical protein